jgi:type I restriction enzyme M protein
MPNPAPQLVQKLWNYCNILHDDGLSFRLRQGCYGGQDGDYVEQLTFLLFLKMADEQSRPPFNPPSHAGCRGTGRPSAVPENL